MGRIVRWSVERVRRSDKNRFALAHHDLPVALHVSRRWAPAGECEGSARAGTDKADLPEVEVAILFDLMVEGPYGVE